MLKPFNKIDYILWAVIAVYTGIIYATLSIVSKIRKFLAEKYGPEVFENIYWIFGIIAVILLVYCFRKFKSKQLIYKLIIFVIFACIYAYYFSGMKYPIEKIHFLEYGLLGALLYIAFTRHIKHWIAIILSINVVYWIGLGDEAIQGILANRVGEIRDCIINLFSGALGIALLWFITDRARKNGIFKTVFLKTTIVFFGITTILSTLFLYYIHGFGYYIETKDPGKICTSLSTSKLYEINSLSSKITPQEMAVYENEALRHLFQREFYFTNDFKGSNGIFYRNYFCCFSENRVLESFYKRFLDEHAQEKSGSLIAGIDKDVAKKVAHNPVMWSDSIRTMVKNAAGSTNSIFKSRVKGTIITSFALKDMLFYCILILAILSYLWFSLPKKKEC